MSLETDISTLLRVGFFSDFDENQLRLIAFGSEKMLVQAGEVLFNDGDEAHDGIVLLSGGVEITIPKPGGRFDTTVLGSGSLMGELSLITPNHRSGTATVIQDCEILIVHRETVLRTLNEYPELATTLFRRISKSVSEFNMDLLKVHDRFD